jgi:hypothetical protein
MSFMSLNYVNIASSNLFRPPSFMKGMARIVDLRGTLNEYSYYESESAADVVALKKDWRIVGNDLWVAIDKYGKSIQKTSKTIS